MVVLHFAATSSINPPGVTPVLTRSQVWTGLQRKVRHANEFVPPITSCVVIKEEKNVVTRRVVFEGIREMTEVCTELAPSRVDFKLEDGTEISNVVGQGPSEKEEDMYMTYAFNWHFPNIEEGSEEATQALAKQQKVS